MKTVSLFYIWGFPWQTYKKWQPQLLYVYPTRCFLVFYFICTCIWVLRSDLLLVDVVYCTVWFFFIQSNPFYVSDTFFFFFLLQITFQIIWLWQPTKSSNISFWWMWMVIEVSNFILSNGVSSLVVWSIRVFNNSRKAWFVCCITLRSCRALVNASVASLVQINCRPSIPTYTINTHQCKCVTLIARQIKSIYINQSKKCTLFYA